MSRRDILWWDQLASLGGFPALGEVPEVRLTSQPVPFARWMCKAKDKKGVVAMVGGGVVGRDGAWVGVADEHLL